MITFKIIILYVIIVLYVGCIRYRKPRHATREISFISFSFCIVSSSPWLLWLLFNIQHFQLLALIIIIFFLLEFFRFSINCSYISRFLGLPFYNWYIFLNNRWKKCTLTELFAYLLFINSLTCFYREQLKKMS